MRGRWNMKIIKRSGVEVFFDSNKIVAAVQKANASVIDYEKLSDEQIQEIADNVEVACENMKRSASVEEIQDMVENQLMNQHAFTVARNYITCHYSITTISYLSYANPILSLNLIESPYLY